MFDSCNESIVQNEVSLIPIPQHVEVNKQKFPINDNTTIVFPNGNEEYKKVAVYLQQKIKRYFDFDTQIKTDNNYPENNSIQLIDLDQKDLEKEEYFLEVYNNSVQISSATANGSFYGIQTLLQLFEINNSANELSYKPMLPGVKIQDKPRFKWRGMHLDVCRHFYDKEFVKKYIDLLAMHKMNTFHWHLTEDQGWRIEIKKYPKVTEVGSYRPETMVDKNWDKFDGIPHSGFYTQEDIKEIVQYASDRFITIVPEIEMPGHSMAALAAYPELGCTGGPYEVAKTWGVFEDVYCAGNEETFTFIENVLTEVIELFPGEYIHIGGDECPKEQWEKCSKCQQRIKEEGLENESELQSYFIKRIEKILVQHKKKLIGWDEILEGGIAPEATVMSWRGTKGGIAAAKMGHDVVMSPNDECYFDHYQGDPAKEPLAIGGLTTLEDVYNYEPIPAELTKEKALHILGAQANVWTEYITTEEHLEYMVLPRMTALSEVVWSKKEHKDLESFLVRLEKQLLRLKSNGYNYRPQ
jgi:hexosaminidase